MRYQGFCFGRFAGLSSICAVLWLAGLAHGQFRDITPRQPEVGRQSPRGGDVTDEQTAPEPIPQTEMALPERPAPQDELLPAAEPFPGDPADGDHRSRSNQGDSRSRAAELGQQMADRIDEELIDDTELRPLRFRGILVGESTEKDLIGRWGEPFKIVRGESTRIFKYRAEPFRQVDVSITDDTVVSILVHLFDLQDPAHVATELRMTRIEPVPVPDSYGNVMGLAFPERGVLLGFDMRDPESLVSKVLLEAINPEPFLLRAEYDFDHNYARQFADIERALQLNPNYARAYWLRARLLSELGRYRDALESVESAIEHDPNSAGYQTLRARLLLALGKFGPASRQLERTGEREDLSLDQRAEIEFLRGQLKLQEKPLPFNAAMRHHLKAIEIAAPLANDPRFEIRRNAKRTLIEAHLAVARDIALGNFQRQQEVVPRWLRRAKALVEEFVARDQGDRALRLEVAAQILAAAADLRNPDDPGKIIDELFDEGRRQIAASSDLKNKHRIEWMLATALAEAVRLERLRGEFDSALDAANDALSLFQQSAPERQSTPEQKYLVGRLYFHIGSLHAVQRKDHEEAIAWYRKAEPMLAVAVPPGLLADPRTHGESFISMGVSYWESRDREKALELTELGTDILQKAVLAKLVDSEALAIPYGNLASMHQSAGNPTEAKAFAELAASLSPEGETTQR